MNLRRIRNDSYQDIVDIWKPLPTPGGVARDTGYQLISVNIRCDIMENTSAQALSIVGRLDVNVCMIEMPYGTPVELGTILIMQTPGLNQGKCWEVASDPVQETGTRRRPATGILAFVKLITLPKGVTVVPTPHTTLRLPAEPVNP